MHLAIEAVGVKHSGGAVVLLDVVRAALRASAIEKVTIFSSPSSHCQFTFPESGKFSRVECPRAEATVLGRIVWLAAGLERDIRRRRPDVLLCMSGIGFAPVPTVVFIQQSLPFCRQAVQGTSARNQIRIWEMRQLMKRSCRRAAAVIAQTPTMADWIMRGFAIPGERIHVIKPWGDAMGMGTQDRGSIDVMSLTQADRRLLYVGNVSSYKRVSVVADAMEQVRRHIPGATLFLTCPPDHEYCKSPGVAGLGYLGGKTLQEAYRRATAFITASLVESGNLTLVEAMSTGVPVIAADRPYARDLCGDAAAYFDPNDKSSVAASIVQTLSSQSQREVMVRRGLEIASAERRTQPYDALIQILTCLGKAQASPLPVIGERDVPGKPPRSLCPR